MEGRVATYGEGVFSMEKPLLGHRPCVKKGEVRDVVRGHGQKGGKVNTRTERQNGTAEFTRGLWATRESNREKTPRSVSILRMSRLHPTGESVSGRIGV